MRPPADEQELLTRARALGGRTVRELTQMLAVPLPPDLRRAKGFVGQLVERALGGGCDARPGPDFAALGVELKTVPVDPRGRIRQSTFVCTAPLSDAACAEWEASRVRHKLARVLWVAVQADPGRPPPERRVGAAWLWSPSPAQEAVLRGDWEELTGAIGAGEVEALDARQGEALQLRPKGADRTARALAYDRDGAPFWAPARGFYLRARFTQTLIEQAGLG